MASPYLRQDPWQRGGDCVKTPALPIMISIIFRQINGVSKANTEAKNVEIFFRGPPIWPLKKMPKTVLIYEFWNTETY